MHADLYENAKARAFVSSKNFASFFMGGFECSSHLRSRRERLDLLASTRHDLTAADDYRQLKALGVQTMRDGVRWHLVEKTPDKYDWSSVDGMLRAANAAGVQVIWDLFHYGWPDGLDIFDASFVERFARFAGAVALRVRQESDAIPMYCPVNEISYFAWAGGSQKLMGPFRSDQAEPLKRQLVRASIAAINAVRTVDPRARIVHAEPVINVEPASKRDIAAAAAFNAFQFEAIDMISGRTCPELGGSPDNVDILGLNFYPDNQWFLKGNTIPLGHHMYKPLSDLLLACHSRYGCSMIISETGAEGSARASWLHYVVGEVLTAISEGADVDGVCLYPITDYPGWTNGRLCRTGLLGVADAAGRREICGPLMEELESSAVRVTRHRAARGEHVGLGHCESGQL
jgi:beta-glucosidase/6-phospho-beta-glucosidase/beta-galactosidase